MNLVSLNRENNENIGVNEDQDSFLKTRTWIVENIWRSINPVPVITTKADYILVFYSKPIPFSDMNTALSSLILLRIPLTPETLGPHFKERIAELKDVMKKTAHTQIQ
jgi:hypothetical protein